MTTRNQRPATPARQYGAVAIIMGFVAATLAAASVLHLSGLVHGHAPPYSPTGAGIAEALIGLALAWGARALTHAAQSGRPVALATIAFAIAGFAFGLTFTVQGGDLPDITYHALTLPVLIATLIVLLRTKNPARV